MLLIGFVDVQIREIYPLLAVCIYIFGSRAAYEIRAALFVAQMADVKRFADA